MSTQNVGDLLDSSISHIGDNIVPQRYVISGTNKATNSPNTIINPATGAAYIWGTNRIEANAAIGHGTAYDYGNAGGSFDFPTIFPIRPQDGGTGIQAGVGGIAAYVSGPGYEQAGSPWPGAIRIDVDGTFYGVGNNGFGNYGAALDSTQHDTWFAYTIVPPGLRTLSHFGGATMITFGDGTIAICGIPTDSGGSISGLPGSIGAQYVGFIIVGVDCIGAAIDGSCIGKIDSDGALAFAGTQTPFSSSTCSKFGNGLDTASATWVTPTETGGFVNSGFKKMDFGSLSGITLALRSDGSLWWTGSNTRQVSGSASGPSETLYFLQVAGLPPLIDFTYNNAAINGLDADGNVWAWGQNDIGDGSTGNALAGANGVTPEIIATDVIFLGTGLQSGVGFKRDPDAPIDPVFVAGDVLYGWGDYPGNGQGYSDSYPGIRRLGVARPTIGASSELIMNIPAIIITANPVMP